MEKMEKMGKMKLEKKLKLLGLMGMLGLSANPVWAEELHYNIVEFSEVASVTVPNDTMNVTLNIQETGKNRQEINNKVTQKLNSILAKAKLNKEFKVESGNRYTRPDYDNQGKIKSWTDYASIQIYSKDFPALSELVADTQNMAMLDGVYFSISPEKRANAVEQATNQLIKSFKTRAEQMSKNLGYNGNYKLVKLEFNQSLNSRSAAPMGAMPMPMSMMRMNKAVSEPVSDSMAVESGEQEITQTVQVRVQF